MDKKTERAAGARHAKRNVGEELLASIRQMKAGMAGDIHLVNNRVGSNDEQGSSSPSASSGSDVITIRRRDRR